MKDSIKALLNHAYEMHLHGELNRQTQMETAVELEATLNMPYGASIAYELISMITEEPKLLNSHEAFLIKRATHNFEELYERQCRI